MILQQAENLEGREKRQKTEPAVGWERGGAGDVGKNLIEAGHLSLSEKSGCEKSDPLVIIAKNNSYGGCHAERL
jgi:hypothetical protein